MNIEALQEWKRNVLIGILLAILCFLTYSNSLHNGFKMDENSILLQNAKVHNLKYIFELFNPQEGISDNHSPVYYRPVTHTLDLLNYLLFHKNPFGYHVVNLTFFFINVFVIFVVFSFLLNQWKVPFLASLLFCVHPINGVLVNYKTATGFLFLILSMQLSILGFLFAELKENKTFWYGFSLICFVVALLCHETAMMFPFYLASVLFFIKKYHLKKIIKQCLPYFLLLLLYLIFHFKYANFKTNIIDKINFFDLSFPNYCATFIKLISWYISKLLFMKGIVLIWVTSVVRDHLFFWNALLLGMMLACIYFIINHRKWPIAALTFSWFLIGILPIGLACFFQPVSGAMIEPHWLFIPSIGFFLLTSSLLFNIQKAINKKVWVMLVFSILLVNYFSSRHYNFLWNTEKRYCQYWLDTVPEFKDAAFCLAGAYMNEHHYDKAASYYQKALTGHFNDWQIYTNLGLMNFEGGNLNHALENYYLALKYNPNSAVTYNDLGLLFLKQNDLAHAEALFLKAIQLNKLLLEPRLNLANIYKQQGKINEAIGLCEENLNIDPRDENSQFILTSLYLDKGEKTKASILARKLLKGYSNPQRLVELGSLMAYNHLGNLAQALYTKALEEDPKNANAFLELGKLYGNREYFNQAIAIWQEGLAIDPHDARFVELIKQAEDLIASKSTRK